MERKWWIRGIGWLALAVATVIIVGVIAGIYSNQPTYVPPPTPHPVIPLSLNYPDTTSFIGGKTGLAFFFKLAANETIAVGTPVAILDPQGEIASSNYSGVQTVNISFDETLNASENASAMVGAIGGIASGVFFNNENNSSVGGFFFISNSTQFLTPYNPGPFKWLVSGDFSPMIEIDFKNGTNIEYTYSEIQIQVASAIDVQNANLQIEDAKIALQDENLNRVNIILTFVLVGVAVIEVFRIVDEFAQDSQSEKAMTQAPKPTNASATSNTKRNHRAGPVGHPHGNQWAERLNNTVRERKSSEDRKQTRLH